MRWYKPMADPVEVCPICFCSVSARYAKAHEDYHEYHGHEEFPLNGENRLVVPQGPTEQVMHDVAVDG